MKKINVFLVLFFVLMVGMISAVLICNCPPVNPRSFFAPSTEATITPLPLATAPQRSIKLTGSILAFAVNPQQENIAIGTTKGVLLYNSKTFKLIRSVNQVPCQASQLSWSPDGKKLAIGTFNQISDVLSEAHLLVLDATTWNVLLDGDKLGEATTNQPVYALAWSPDNRSLAVSLPMMDVIVIDTQTGKTISTQNEFVNGASSLTWSPDGTRLVANGDMAKGLRRWKVSTDEAVRLFDKRLENAAQVAWSPDGTQIASTNWEAICFWTAATNMCDGLIETSKREAYGLAWSADGAKLATGGSALRIWDTQTGKLLSAFGEDRSASYVNIQWLALNQPLVTLQNNDSQPNASAIRFWDVATGKVLAEFVGDVAP